MAPQPALSPREGRNDERSKFIESIVGGNTSIAPASLLPDTSPSGSLERFLTGIGDSLDELRADTSARISTALEFAASVKATPAPRKAEAERLAAAFAERDTIRFRAKHGWDKP